MKATTSPRNPWKMRSGLRDSQLAIQVASISSMETITTINRKMKVRRRKSK
jgi:hypothetical protein